MFNVTETINWVMNHEWRTPTELPPFDNIKVFSLDTETWDPDLITTGPGFVYDKAKVIGFSYAFEDGNYGYLPLIHNEANTTLPAKLWLKVLLSDPDRIVVFANARYDIEALWGMGISIKCKIEDIQVLDALLDEEQKSYSLDSISKRRGFPGKNKAEMESHMLKNAKGEPDYTRLAEVHPKYVGPYAEMDALLTYGVYVQQLEEIKKEELETVAKLESDLIPVLADMRIRGLRVDVEKAKVVNDKVLKRCEELLTEIKRAYGDINPFSTDQIAPILINLGMVIPQTEKGNNSITNEFLKEINDPTCQALYEYRRSEKIRRDFINGMIIEGSYKGRLHPQWFQTRGSSFMSGDDTGGTRSGRIASMNPALTTIPTRHPELGPLTRSMFLPEEGDLWFKGDFSQQEPRITLHYAYILGLRGAAEMRDEYISNPKIDYHQSVTDRVNQVRDKPIDRRAGKDINLGLAYGLGKVKMAERLGLSSAASQSIIDDYHIAVPFMGELQKRAMSIVESRGYVKTNLGRRRRFDSWEPISYQRGKFGIRGYDAAVKAYGRVRRSGVHKALNSIIQGTAAEQMKSVMVRLYADGFKMLITLYDELGISIQDAEQAKYIKNLMETNMEFTVPHNVDPALGPSWGELK